MHPDYLEHIKPHKEVHADSTKESADDWQARLQVDLAKEMTAKWRKRTIMVSVAAILIITAVLIWHYTYPKYVGIPIHSEQPYIEGTKIEAQIEEKFLQMTNVLRYLVDEVKKHDEALALRTKTLSESSSFDFSSRGVVNSTSTQIPSFMRAVVTSSKANVRPVPNLKSEPIMTLDKGTEILVDLQQDEWNRVVTPTGQKAWMSSKVMELEDAG